LPCCTEVRKNKPDSEDLQQLETQATQAWQGTSGTERKTLSPAGWVHIWRGDETPKGDPIGFHWKGREAEAWHEGVGDPTASNGDGFYHQAVVRKGTYKPKAEGSTFFPDDWTAQQVKDAIETCNSSDQITTSEGFGVKLQKSGGTIYPSL
jgi:Bacterial EndoU nuclease